MNIVHDPLKNHTAINFINTIFPTITYQQLVDLQHNDLDMAWRTWLENSKYNTVQGLDQFKYSAFCPGTTDAFGEFISRYPAKRVRVSRSDFVLTKILAKSYGRNFLPLEDGELSSDDCLIMSFPFSGNGGQYPGVEQILDQADQLDIPVFVDGAYFGISHGVNYPLNRKCVKDFTISLSKNLAGNPLRLGIRFTKEPVDDGISAGLIGSDIFDRLNALLSIRLLEQFSHNWFIEKYLPISQEICQQNNLKPTNTVSITIGTQDMKQYQRGDYIRVCITEELSRSS